MLLGARGGGCDTLDIGGGRLDIGGGDRLHSSVGWVGEGDKVGKLGTGAGAEFL